MKVAIKSFDVNMEVKSKGVEFGVRSKDGATFLGDCYLTMTGLTWCGGRITRENGKKISWNDFIALMMDPDTLKKAIKEAKRNQ